MTTTQKTTGGNGVAKPNGIQTGRSWYAALLDAERPPRQRAGARRPKVVFSILAGVRFWLGARQRYPAVETMTYLGPPFWLLERLFGGRRRYLIVLEFITSTNGSWTAHGRARRIRAGLRTVYLNQIVAPALRQSLLAAQVLSAAEAETYATFFNVPRGRFCFLPWMRLRSADELPGLEGRSGVFASGRAFCNWHEVFSIAQGQPWRLTIMCGDHDLTAVRRMNETMLDSRAEILCEQPRAVHERLLRSSAVYLLALREEQVSAGHIRLAECTQAGIPTVISSVSSVADYVRDGEDTLMYAPGDIAAARSAIRSLIFDPLLSHRIRTQAHAKGLMWTRSEYVAAIRQFVDRVSGEHP
jgi:hypothetical protein